MKYRFKTEEEFISDYGERWRFHIIGGWNNMMDSLFGTPIASCHHPCWMITSGMLVENLRYTIKDGKIKEGE